MKEPIYACLSEAKASHSHKTYNEVSSSVLHFLQVVLLLSPIIYKCLLKIALIITNKCTYIKFHMKTLKIAPTCFDPKIILRELRHFKNIHKIIPLY